jgi:RNA polymerase sigma-70 factor (ECF subfamily)
MVDTPDNSRENTGLSRPGAPMSAPELKAWFAREVLPLEAPLVQFLRRNWRNKGEIEDLLQEVYVRVYEAARKELPQAAKPFVFATARNLLINRFRQQQVVAIEAVADLETLEIGADDPAPDRAAIAHEEFRRLQSAIDRLPPRCREAVILGRIEGLSGREIAQRMGISEAAVSKHLTRGLSLLSDMLHREADAT